MIAQCYKALNNEKDYLALYNQISGHDNPFWKKIAKEKIEEANFNNEVGEIKKELERGIELRDEKKESAAGRK